MCVVCVCVCPLQWPCTIPSAPVLPPMHRGNAFPGARGITNLGAYQHAHDSGGNVPLSQIVVFGAMLLRTLADPAVVMPRCPRYHTGSAHRSPLPGPRNRATLGASRRAYLSGYVPLFKSSEQCCERYQHAHRTAGTCHSQIVTMIGVLRL